MVDYNRALQIYTNKGLCICGCGRSAVGGTKRCSKCRNKQKLRLKERRGRLSSAGLCIACGKRKAVKGFVLCRLCNAKDNESNSRKRLELKIEVMTHYCNGTPRCMCCGETILMMLGMDHVKEDGAKHRKQIGGTPYLLRWLKKHNHPPGFQVLCHNCNMAKYINGGICPHKQS